MPSPFGVSARSFAVFTALLTLSACGVADFDVNDPDEVLASTTEAELRSNKDPDRLVVYSINIENMLWDWKDLVHEMSEHALRPDLVMVQQVTDAAELQRMVSFMERRMGVGYTGVVAKVHPEDQRFQNQVTPRPTVTTGLIFRNSRFDLVNKESWMPWGRGFNDNAFTCDERSAHTGYETLRLRLWDQVAKKHVVAISLRHWTFHPCSSKNVFDIVKGVDSGANAHPALGAGADLHIVAGDFNDDLFDGDGQYKCWYRQMNNSLPEGQCTNDENLGFTDPQWRACGGDRSCMKQNNGIDHIFDRRSDGQPAKTDHFDEISFDQAHNASRRATGGDTASNVKSRDGYNDVGPNYSQHRARRAYLYYQ